MSWGEHVQDMINRMNANEALKSRKWEIYDRIQNVGRRQTRTKNQTFLQAKNKLSKAERIRIRQNAIHDNKIDNVNDFWL